MTNNVLLRSALVYAEKFGYSVIPVGPHKKPLVKWTEFQSRKATADEIKSWWEKWPTANVGIVTGKISGLSVIDIDEDEGHTELEPFISDTLIFPTVTSPSGGKHYYFQYHEDCPTKTGVLPSVDTRGDGGYITAPPSVREDGKYIWDKGLRIGDVELPPFPEVLASFLNGQKWTNQQSSGQLLDKNGQALFTNGRRDEDLFHIAHSLLKGGCFHYEIEQVIQRLAVSCGFPEDEAAMKVKSAIDRAGKKERNLQSEVREFVDMSTGNFELIHIYNALNIKERKEKKNISEALHKLCKENIIEKFGNKNGHYRKVDTTIEAIDFLNADDSELEVALPLGLNSFVKILPKQIIIVAGAPNSGKTALLLNIAHDNLAKHKIEYFSSEMGPAEMKDRLAKFEEPWSFWENFKPKDRSTNFSDVVVPDAINIIDYMELDPEQTYMVEKYIRDIYDRLTTGIAIIGLQKNPGATLARGGTGTTTKARLVLTMDNNRIEIYKGKNWRYAYQNPNGMAREFKLAQGCKFIGVDMWMLSEEREAYKKGR